MRRLITLALGRLAGRLPEPEPIVVDEPMPEPYAELRRKFEAAQGRPVTLVPDVHIELTTRLTADEVAEMHQALTPVKPPGTTGWEAANRPASFADDRVTLPRALVREIERTAVVAWLERERAAELSWGPGRDYLDHLIKRAKEAR